MARKSRGKAIIPARVDLDTKQAHKNLDDLIKKASDIKLDLRTVGQAEGRLKRVIKNVQSDVGNIKLNPRNLEDFQTLLTGIKNSTGDIEAALRNTANSFVEKFENISVSINGNTDITGLGPVLDNLEAIKEASNVKFSISGLEQAGDGTAKIAAATEQAKQSVEEQTKALEAQRKETEKLAAAQEKVAKTRKGSSRIKTREFTREEYDAHTEQYEKDNDGNVESLEDTVDIIRQASRFGTQFAADMTTSCKRAATAVNRFFSAIDPEKYPALASWKDGILESIQNGFFSEIEKYNGMSTGSYSWGVEEIGDGTGFYVYLNTLDVAKDKEKEYSAYLEEEFKRRDEGLEKQNELTRRLFQTYEKLNELHANEPSWDKNNEVESIKQRLGYYEQEKALLQDIQNLKEEFSAIPSRYTNPTDFNKVVRVSKSTLRFGDYGNGNLKDNERATAIYQAELESAIKRQERLTAAVEQTAKAREKEAEATGKVAEAQEKLNKASRSQNNNSERINELKEIIKVQNEWVRYLDGSLNADNFKTSGKRQATEQLRALTKSLVSKRMNNYADDAWRQYPEEMTEVAWMQGYKEAQRQGVAQSTLTRYDTDARYSYDSNVKTLQEEYAFHKNILEKSQKELEILQEQDSAIQKSMRDMEQLQKLIGDLNNKYGEESFSNIFGKTISSFGELNASNATRLYDALIAKNEEYQKSVEEQAQKTKAAAQEMQAFITQNQELAKQYSTNAEFMSKYSDLMNQMSQSTLTAEDATRQLNEWIDSSGLEKAALSAQEARKAFEGIDFGEFLGAFNIDKEYIPELIEDFKELGALIQSQQTDKAAQKIEQISQKLQRLGGNLAEVDDLYKEFLDYASSSKIKINDYWIGEVGEQNWKDTYVKGKRVEKGLGSTYRKYFIKDTSKLGTGKYASADYPDQFIKNMDEKFQNLFSKYVADYNNPVQSIISMINAATDAIDSRVQGFIDRDYEEILYSVQDIADKIESNLLGTKKISSDDALSYISNALAALEAEKNSLLSGTGDTSESRREQLNIVKDRTRSLLDQLKEKRSDIDLSEFEGEYARIFDEGFNSFLERLPEIDKQKQEFLNAYNGIIEKADGSQQLIESAEKFYTQISRGAMTSAEAIGALQKEMGGIELPEGVAAAAERAADAEERHAAAAGETRKQLEGQKNAEDEVVGFTEAQVANEIKRIQEAIHSKEAGLDQVANTEGLQAALAALNERIGNNSPFKLISAQVDSMGESVDQATLRFQNLDGSISLVQKWAMNDGELTLGRISASQSFKDQEKFDAELYQANATSKVDKLWSSLSGVEDVSQKVKDTFAAIRTEISQIDSKDALGKFKVSFDTLNNMVQEFKNNYKSLNSISDTVRVAQSKMANAETVLGAKETSLSKYVDTNGYEEAARIIGEMRTQLDNYKNAEQNLAEGEDPVQKRVAAYKEYIKLEKELDAQTKKIQSESQFESFSKVMKDAQTEIDTAILKLQKFAEVEGFDKANQEITNMTNAMNQFNSENSSIEEKAQAVKDYEAAQRSLAKQMQYLNEVQKNNSTVNTEQKRQMQEQEQQIKQYYQSILDTVNKINSLDVQITGLKGKNGNGFYTGLIDQLQAEKSKLIDEVRTTLQTVNDEFGSGLVGSQNVSLSGARFFSEEDTQNLNRFMQSAQVQSALASGDINKFTECVNQLSAAFTNSEKIGIEAATKIQEGFSKAQEAASKIFNIDPNAGIVGSKGNINESSDSYQQAKNAYEMLKLARAKIGDKSEADWSGGEAVVIETLTKAFLEYANTLDTVAQKEQKYFAGKSKYTDGQDMDAMVVRAQEATNGLKEIQDVMSKTAKSFAGDNGAVITKFTQSADGISKLDFSVFDRGTNSLRNFSLEMGSVTEGMYITETTVKNTMSAFNAAEKQLQSAGSLMNQMKESGLESSSGFERIKNAVEKLSSALSSGASDTTLTKLTKEAKLTTSEVDKLYKKWLQMQDAVERGDAFNLGKIDLGGNVQKQLANSLKQWADTAGVSNVKITSLNTSTGKFKVTAEGADNTVRTFTGDLSRLNGVATMQQTGIQDLGTKWERFKASLASTGKQFATALIGVNIFYKAIAQVRQGYQYVKEIDLAMTELKKVTDETAASYDNFLKTASKTAGTIGSTVSDFTEATANFARLGYSLEESSKMAETAIVYKNVADGLDTVEQSTESIISTMKAYGIEANDTMSIIDKFNEVGVIFADYKVA